MIAKRDLAVDKSVSASSMVASAIRAIRLSSTVQLRALSTTRPPPTLKEDLVCGDRAFDRDAWTNVTPRVLSYVGRDLHRSRGHPLWMVKERVARHFHSAFQTNRGYPVFSVHDSLSPVVTLQQNYDSLLVPKDHPSRKK